MSKTYSSSVLLMQVAYSAITSLSTNKRQQHDTLKVLWECSIYFSPRWHFVNDSVPSNKALAHCWACCVFDTKAGACMDGYWCSIDEHAEGVFCLSPSLISLSIIHFPGQTLGRGSMTLQLIRGGSTPRPVVTTYSDTAVPFPPFGMLSVTPHVFPECCRARNATVGVIFVECWGWLTFPSNNFFLCLPKLILKDVAYE